MRRQLGHELPFPEVENRILFAVDILDPETKEARQVKDEEQGEIGEHPAFSGVEMKKGIFDKVKQLGVGFGLFEAFL